MNKPTITAAQLNEVAALLGTTDKQTVIDVVIGTLVKAGADVADAVDAVFGEGAYKRLAHQVYDQLRAKAAH